MSVRVNKSAFNIREKLSELERPIGVKGNELMRAETLQDARDLVSAGRKNLIINGDFRISQRGNYTSATSTSSNAYYLDRWYHNGSTSNTTVQQKGNQSVNGYNVTTMRYSSASGTNSTISMGQQVETLNWIHLKGKKVTFSAWVKTNNPNVGLRNYSGVQNIGTRHSGSGNWEYLTWSYTITTSDTNLYFLIDSYNGAWNDITDQYIEIAMVQIEEGSNATEFEHRSYGEELSLCQRYYEKSFPDGVTPARGTTTTSLLNGGQPTTTLDWYASFSAGTLATHHYFRVPKRGVPQMTVFGTSDNKCLFFDFGTKSLIYPGLIIDSPTKIGFRSYNNGSGLTNNSSWGVDYFNWTAEAEL